MKLIEIDYLNKIKTTFQAFLKSEQGIQWQIERDEKDRFINQNFNQKTIEQIDIGILRELLHKLWSFEIWTNKDWLLEQMLETNIEKIRNAFKELLFGNQPLSHRFNNMKNIKMFGAASISEILTHHNHLKYPIWNRKAKAGLIKLGINPETLPKSSQISGGQYETFCALVISVFNEVKEIIPEVNDLFELDYLLYFVAGLEKEKGVAEYTFEHDTAINDIIQLGDGLGFEVQKEFFITHGCRLDAIWRTRVANLGVIKYAFEVHKSGSKDSAILNLQRSRIDPSIQKVVLVSTEGELEKFKKEISTLPEDFRKSVGYFDVKDLQLSLEYQESLKEILLKIGLLKP